MKQISQELKDHISAEVTSLAKCIKLTLRNGVVKGFTGLDEDILFEEVAYKTGNINELENISESLSDESAVQAISMILEADEITEEDISKNIYDDAKVEIFLLNYQDTSQGKIILKTGFLGKITKKGESFSAELNSYFDKLDVAIGDYYSPRCRASFCDERCKLNITDFTLSSAVTQVISDNSFLCSALDQANGYFNSGVIEFTSGHNAETKFTIGSFDGGIVILSRTPVLAIGAGDSFNITRGCDKNFSTCISEFDNALNFRGEPHLPGTDTILKTAAS